MKPSQDACAAAARSITEAEVFIFRLPDQWLTAWAVVGLGLDINGAGWSADSGLAVYADVAKDICQPHWLFKEPQLFWGFWGQCYNDYRLTDPHEGYEMVHHWVGKLFRHTKVAKELQQRCPYEVKGRAGAFHVFTSNVDAHHYDWFPACEIRECHGNTEIYQCPGIWRAPLEYRFHVDKETMLAPKEAPEEAFEVETNHWAPPQGDEDPMSTVPRVGRVTGSARRHTLRFMRSGAVVAESPASAAKRGFAANHPVCPECGGPARPAILMFGDYSWRDNDAQEDRWETWLDQVNDLATERTADFNPLRVALLEVGAGNNVTTVRSRSEHILRDLVEKGAEAKLLRVNPDFPLVGNRDLEPHTISLMGRGLESLRLINAFMGTNSFGLTECPPPPPDMPPPPPDAPPPNPGA
ncbi:unnamed protein product [Durusdinium trenchii]|uniref:Deacetylase sirtuin-type domain-containing protein n=1 Tax=Durusdinium trenchii TaxID=1381693 RepID=A0ABP0NDQ6_9DINO